MFDFCNPLLKRVGGQIAECATYNLEIYRTQCRVLSSVSQSCAVQANSLEI
jgi:hypothetical protein